MSAFSLIWRFAVALTLGAFLLPFTAAQSVGPFTLLAEAPGTKYNGRFVDVFLTEGSDFVFSLFYPDRPAAKFSINSTTQYLTSNGVPRGSSSPQTLYTYGRSNHQPDKGYAYLNTKEVLQQRGTFTRDTWRAGYTSAGARHGATAAPSPFWSDKGSTARHSVSPQGKIVFLPVKWVDRWSGISPTSINRPQIQRLVTSQLPQGR